MARSDGEMDRTAASQSIDGYVGDSLYPSSFHPNFAPPNIDAMLVHAGIASPRGHATRAPFTMADIGCGDGVGLILNAAAHPEGHFIRHRRQPGPCRARYRDRGRNRPR